MLSEAFLRALVYRREETSTSAAAPRRASTYPDGPEGGDLSVTRPGDGEPPPRSAVAGLNHGEEDPSQTQEPRVEPPPAGLPIPWCSPALPLGLDLAVGIDDCSLLIQYPDLTVADAGRVSQNLFRTSTTVQPSPDIPIPQADPQQEPPRDPPSSLPDQGYLVMGASVSETLDLPESRLEPMSNSLLNGLLERQLEEVYLQHLTDNLARCNSHLENSLLRGLVPPPQLHGPDSLDSPSLQVRSGEDDKKDLVTLSTQNVPCSSNFSSPVLRISEAEQPCLTSQ